MSVAQRLSERGYTLEPATLQVFGFHTAVRSGALVFTSGQVPIQDGVAIRGRVGADLSVEEGYRAAELCAVNGLRAIAAVADPEDIIRVVKVFGMVNVADGFNQTSEVINGATDLLNAVIDAPGSHARSAIGAVLPNNLAVEVELIVELRS